MSFAVPNIETDLQCHYIHAPAGNRCGSPAMRGEYYCYHHHLKHANRAQRRVLIDPEVTRLELPVLEDRASIFTAIAAVIHRLGENTIDTKRSGQMIYGLLALLHALPAQPAAKPAPATKARHPERSSALAPNAVEAHRETPPATAADTPPPPDETAPAAPPKTINITKQSLLYFLRSRHCYNCNAELFPPEELTERRHPGAPPEVIPEATRPPQLPGQSPALPAPTGNEKPATDTQQSATLPSLQAVARVDRFEGCRTSNQARLAGKRVPDLAILTTGIRFALHSPRRSVSLRLARMFPGILVSSGQARTKS